MNGPVKVVAEKKNIRFAGEVKQILQKEQNFQKKKILESFSKASNNIEYGVRQWSMDCHFEKVANEIKKLIETYGYKVQMEEVDEDETKELFGDDESDAIISRDLFRLTVDFF